VLGEKFVRSLAPFYFEPSKKVVKKYVRNSKRSTEAYFFVKETHTHIDILLNKVDQDEVLAAPIYLAYPHGRIHSLPALLFPSFALLPTPTRRLQALVTELIRSKEALKYTSSI